MIDRKDFSFKKIADMSGREMFCIERLRADTFVCEQKIIDPELDDQDLEAIHVFLLNQKQTRALAVCRIFVENNKWILGRVAVDSNLRGQHLGAEMMAQVHKYLRQKGISQLYCHAQLQAKPFYDSLGYQAQGDVFDEAGVKHIMMYYNL